MPTIAPNTPPENGGEWLVKKASFSDTFIPEDFSEEQMMMKDLCSQFIETEVNPILDKIDSLEPGLMPSLLQKAGEQGLLSVSFPEQYGGLGKDFVTSTIINEYLGAGYSFSVAIAAHTGIGTLPILYFGTDAQKQKYLPKLVSGEWVGAYGLTEPGSGSDALSSKSSAVLSADGKYYILNGQKCWITNGGFANVFIVFAKIDGAHFTGFILEKGMDGFTQGAEEKKMGIKGSSTVQLYFQDAKIPVENLLGEPGKGHKIAFNILNIGRLKLCAAALGGARRALKESIGYANTREQFKQPIASFGAIKHKIAEMAIKIFVIESALYRTAHWINLKEAENLSQGKAHNESLLNAAEEFAIECAMLKVAGSEILDFVVDEGLQIHGGNGFSAEYNISRAYRDSRINRIYEGTNEINRLLILDMTLKRAMQGRLNILKPVMETQNELMSIPDFYDLSEAEFEYELKLISGFKKAILITAGAAVQKLMMKIDQEQEVLMNIADMAIVTFNAESALLRVMKMESKKIANCEIYKNMASVYLYDAADAIYKYGKDAVNAFAEGDDQRMLLMGLKRFTKANPINVKQYRRTVADYFLQQNKF